MKATVFLREKQTAALVDITGPSKPEIGAETQAKWNRILEVINSSFGVPVALIVQVHQDRLTVFSSTGVQDGCFAVGMTRPFGEGGFCETVIGECRTLLIENLLHDPVWKNAPCANMGVASYYGFPILWPDGESFGILNIMDSKKRIFSEERQLMLGAMRDSIEKDLALLIENEKYVQQSGFVSNLIDAMPVSIILLDRELRIEMMNRQAEQLIGAEFYDIVGRRPSELVDHPGVKELEDHFVQSGVSDYSIVFQQDVGEPRHFLIDYKSIYSINNEFTHVAVNIRDISHEKSIENELNRKNEFLNQLAVRDRLTNLYNHVTVHELLLKKLEEAIRYKTELAIAMLDIDNFKEINHSFGHRIGDHILADVSKIIKESVRSADIVGRYGGEEFMIIMPQTDLDNAYQVIERVRTNCENREIEKINLTVSAGLVTLENESSMEKLLNCVEQALYRAKSIGKNVVVVRHNC